jgi:hypothetical protein
VDFWFELTTPAGTAIENALELELKLTEGTISQVWMVHPEGCQGLAHAAIFEGIHQRYPHNPEGSYHGNAVPMIWDDNYELKAPALLKLKTWNEDDTYDHTVYVRITILRGVIDKSTQALIDALGVIKQLLTGKRVL